MCHTQLPQLKLAWQQGSAIRNLTFHLSLLTAYIGSSSFLNRQISFTATVLTLMFPS